MQERRPDILEFIPDVQISGAWQVIEAQTGRVVCLAPNEDAAIELCIRMSTRRSAIRHGFTPQ